MTVYGCGVQSFSAVICRDVPRMVDTDGIDDPLLPVRILQNALIQLIDACVTVQYVIHLPYLVITICTAFLQRVYQPLLPAVCTYRDIIK